MRIDHLVWYHADLDHGCQHFGEAMDRAPLYGGEHPGEGTANAVMALGPETYLEILGRDPGQSEDCLDPEVRGLTGFGLYHWAVGGLDLTEVAERAAKGGLTGGALVPGSRQKPDGSWLGWTCWGLRDHPFGALIPFFIDWGKSLHPAASAPLGGRLAHFKVHTPEAEQLRGIYWLLELDIEVIESREAFLSAVLESHKGRVELRSFSPVPRGYVI